MPLNYQQKLVIDMLPENIRNEVVVKMFDITQEKVDRQVKKVYSNRNILSPIDGNIPATPQSLLDTAVYQLGKQSGSMASESLWLCESLALKNLCLTNGFNPKTHSSKNRVTIPSKSMSSPGNNFF